MSAGWPARFRWEPGTPLETYLSIPRILEAAREARADALHPGYGFLSESAAFARAVEKAGLIWVGPPPSAMEQMGDKLAARRRARQAGVPIVPGSDGSEADDAAIARKAAEIGFPVLVKPSAGGGGKGMALVEKASDLPRAVEEAGVWRRRLSAIHGSTWRSVSLVRGTSSSRSSGTSRATSCISTSASAASSGGIRRSSKRRQAAPWMRGCAPRWAGRCRSSQAVGYVGAGTVEFLLDEGKNFYFLEMNTRLQVEHPITEETLGLDLVRAQIEVAAGAVLPQAWRAAKILPRDMRSNFASTPRMPRPFCRARVGCSPSSRRPVPGCGWTREWRRAPSWAWTTTRCSPS